MQALQSFRENYSCIPKTLLGHPGNPVGLLVTSLFEPNYITDIGVIISVDFRMPFPSEDPEDISLFKILFDKKYMDVSRLELESKFYVHSERISLPPEGIDLKPNPTNEELKSLSRLMALVHKYDYLLSRQIYKQ